MQRIELSGYTLGKMVEVNGISMWRRNTFIKDFFVDDRTKEFQLGIRF